MQIRWLNCRVLSCALLAIVATCLEPASRYVAYRVKPANIKQLEFLHSLSAGHDYRINFWQQPSHVGGNVDLMIPFAQSAQLIGALKAVNLTTELLLDDVQQFIRLRDAENRLRQERTSEFVRRDDSGMPFFELSQYHSYDEMVTYMSQLARRFPHLVQMISLGQTHEGRSIYAVQIGARKRAGVGKPAIWIDGGIHAREWVSPAAALYFIYKLVSGYSSDSEISKLVNELDWYVAPSLNPDGYEHSRSSDNPEVRLWRKNRSPLRCPAGLSAQFGNQFCCRGVDLNRNYDFHWGETGSSTDPCSEIYQGATPFSEPETRAVRDFVNARKSSIGAFVTMHSYSQIWMYPYGHKRRAYPDDVNDLQRVAMQAKDALQSVYGTVYTVGTGADTLYPASGGAEDWAKEGAGVKYAYLLELRPSDSVWDGFFLKEQDIIPTGKETFEGIKVVARAALQQANQEQQLITSNGITASPNNFCNDYDANCQVWAQNGACQAWAQVMQRRCAKSCGFCTPQASYCTDNWTECAQWRMLGMCPTVMNQCRLSCGLCSNNNG